MSAEENKAIVQREFREMFNCDGDLDAAAEIYDADYVGHEPTTGDIRGVEEARQFAEAYRSAFPDLETVVEEQVAEGGRVATRFGVRGTHEGETDEFGSPTGKRIEFTGITLQLVAGGKILEDWTNFDALGLLRQLGQIPESQEATG